MSKLHAIYRLDHENAAVLPIIVVIVVYLQFYIDHSILEALR
jgi:hypothetical protein